MKKSIKLILKGKAEILKEDIENENWYRIIAQLESNADYASIKSRACNAIELKRLRSIKTGLSRFKNWKIELLIKRSRDDTLAPHGYK